MAKAISTVPHEVHVQGNTVSVQDSLQETARALDKVRILTKKLEDAGWLDVLTAVLDERDTLLGILLEQVDKPGTLALMQNALNLGQVLSSVPSGTIASLGEGFSAGLHRLDEGSVVEVRGIWDVLRAVRDPDISRGFAMILTVLKSIGESLGERGTG